MTIEIFVIKSPEYAYLIKGRIVVLTNMFRIAVLFSLREKYPNTEFFLVCIFPYLDWMQENTEQKKLSIWTLCTQC